MCSFTMSQYYDLDLILKSCFEGDFVLVCSNEF
jgi:hypothetical protein